MDRKSTLVSLTKAEEEIMHIIWALDKCMVRDIMDQLDRPDIPHSTVSSVVRILEQKGFVGHKAYGKTYEYFPLISKDDYAKQGLKNLVEKFFNGSPRKLVSYLVQQEQLNLDELNELLQSVDNIKGE